VVVHPVKAAEPNKDSVRLAQKMQAGLCINVGIQLEKAHGSWPNFWANLASFSPVARGESVIKRRYSSDRAQYQL
jgi:hypothetical protein